MPTQDEEIARHLREALRSGELAKAQGFGQALVHDAAWEATPDDFRMPFKILKDAGFAPPEVEMLRERARLRALRDATTDAAERVRLQALLSDLSQKITVRLEAMRSSGSL